ncbi:hypothetical protein [Acidovorax sp. NB1]|nr:hypothetical protein [Acidovorax sp. NB1]
MPVVDMKSKKAAFGRLFFACFGREVGGAAFGLLVVLAADFVD